MNRRILQSAYSLLIFTVACFILSSASRAGEQPSSRGEHCNIHQNPCSMEIGDCTIILDITPKPVKAMEELIFTVTLEKNCSSGVPVIDLSMPGMIMGENKVILRKIGEGVYQGTGVIVRCPSGRKTWQAAVTIPEKGTAEFIFDVIY